MIDTTVQDISGAITRELPSLSGTVDISPGGGGNNPYEGPYTVTPQVTEQTLRTRAKTMTDDVTVLEIPYVSVSNLSGGNTVTIGGI